MTVRLCIAGSGFFSQFHYDAWSRLDVDLVGVCSLDHEQAKRAASTFPDVPVFADFERMLDDAKPDLVDIITPPPTHLPFIEAALHRGIPAICQKPFCGSLQAAMKAVSLAKSTGVSLIVHENFRFQPWHTELRRQVASGAIGDAYQGTFRLRPGDGQGAVAYLDRQPYFQEMPRLLVHETLVHVIDVFRALFGEVNAVYADLRRLNPVIKGEDAGFIILECASGQRCVIDGNRLVDHRAENRRLVMGDMWLEGSEGVLRLDGDGGIHHRPFGGNAEADVSYVWNDHGYAGDCVYLLCKHVLHALHSGGKPVNDAESYVINLRIVEAVYQSAKEGRRIEIEGLA